MEVYVSRNDMTGTERTFASSYRADDIIRYNRNSKKAKLGEYAQVLGIDHEKNEIIVWFEDGRTLTYNPKRLSGVSVYYASERAFAEGDRVQFRAPDTEKRIANGEIGTITKIEPDQIRLALDSGREISVDPSKFRHLDYGYAVTSHSAQGLTFARVLVNADTQESARLLNDRTAYVAISRARYDALIYTDSTQNLSEALNREIDKVTAIEAIQDGEREVKKDRNELRPDPPAPQQQQLGFDHSLDQTAALQSPTHTDPAPTKAPELTIESPIAISSARYDAMIRTDSTHNLSETLNRGTNKETAIESTLDDDRELKKDRDRLTQDPSASQQQLPFDQGLDPAPTKAAELEIEAPEIELGALIL